MVTCDNQMGCEKEATMEITLKGDPDSSFLCDEHGSHINLDSDLLKVKRLDKADTQ